MRKSEVEELQARLQRGSSATDAGSGVSSEALVLREQLLSAGREHCEESSQLRERYEASLSISQKEVERLKASTERQSQEISDLKQRLQQATRENIEMMDSWKTKLDALVGDHQRALEELKASLTGDRGAAESTGGEGEGTTPEMRAALESLRMEHQLEVENLKAKHEIDAAVMAKEREDLRARLQELRDQLAESEENWKIQVETKSNQHVLELREVSEKLQKAELRISELYKSNEERDRPIQILKEQLELAEKKMVDYEALQKAEAQSRAEILSLQEKLRVSENRLQAVEAVHTTKDVNMIENNDNSEEKIKLKQNMEETLEKLTKREKEVSTLTTQVDALKTQITALEEKVQLGEKKADGLVKEKTRLEGELESMTKKSHDASGQLVIISQELLKKERSLNELRVMLLESPRHSPGVDRDLIREVHRTEWRQKEQKLQDDIKSLREKLLMLGRERSSPDHRRYSMMDPSTSDTEVSRLRQRLLNTEEALRSALEHNQHVDQLVQAMYTRPDKHQAHASANSANGIHQEDTSFTHEEEH